MDIYNSNLQTIIGCIKKGCKNRDSRAVGVEIEHFVTDVKTGAAIPYTGGVDAIMRELASSFDERVFSEGFLIGLSNDNYHITLEPGAQLEISIKPTESIDEIRRIYDGFISLVKPILDTHGYRLETYGYLPRGRAGEVTLIPKKRYKFMDAYFKSTGKRGINMMRATASTQVSVDFADERDMVKKFRAANILSPIFALICDNSPVFEQKPFAGNTLRAYIWSDVDNERCGIVPSALDADFSFKKYAEYVCSLPAILIPDGNEMRFTGGERICDIYKNTPISEAEAEHLLSMFFPDVRLKQYIEIRPADSMPIEYVLSYAALIKGVFSSAETFDFGVNVRDIKKARENIILKGFYADVYDMKAYALAEKVYETAESGLDESEKKLLLPLKNIIYNKRTLKETVNLAKG